MPCATRSARELLAYVPVQIAGAVAGVVLAHAMFGLDPVALGVKVRSGYGIWLSEAVAALGLLLTILLGHRAKPAEVPALVGAYIAAGYWFTASTAFANPAVTIARAFTRTFAGIRPVDMPGFIVAELVGVLIALPLAAVLTERSRKGGLPHADR